MKPAKLFFGFAIFLFILFWGAAGTFVYLIKKEIISLTPTELPAFEISNFFGAVEAYSSEKGIWEPANRGAVILNGDKIRTGPGSEIDFKLPGKIHFRLKENSEVEKPGPRFLAKHSPVRLRLNKGTLFTAIERTYTENFLEVSSPYFIADAFQGAMFRAALDTKYEIETAWVGVLQGEVRVRDLSRYKPKTVVIRSLQKSDAPRTAFPTSTAEFSKEDWHVTKEAYELIEKTALTEARQLDLSKKAGNFFQYVFDHGTFYTPKIGFCSREFIQDEATGEVHLEVVYDVFPKGSFVGVYIKTRDFDISQFKSLKFKVKRDPEEGYPESFRMELKVRTDVIRAFAPTQFKQEWETFEVPLKFSRAAPVNEVTIVFTNEKAGEHSKGLLYFKDFELVPIGALDEKPVEAAPSEKPLKEVPLITSQKLPSL